MTAPADLDHFHGSAAVRRALLTLQARGLDALDQVALKPDEDDDHRDQRIEVIVAE